MMKGGIAIMLFMQWLQNEKNYTQRSARDVQSRLKRVLLITNEKEPTDETLNLLEASEEFATFKNYIRSQLRRAVKLYEEYSSK